MDCVWKIVIWILGEPAMTLYVSSAHHPFHSDYPAPAYLDEYYQLLCQIWSTKYKTTLPECASYTTVCMHQAACRQPLHLHSLSIIHASFARDLAKWSGFSKASHKFFINAGKGTPRVFSSQCLPDVFFIFLHVLTLPSSVGMCTGNWGIFITANASC